MTTMKVEQTCSALLRLARELEERAVPRLPAERDLALRLGTSRTTVRKALDALESEGVVRRVRGRAGGAYLTAVPQTDPLSEDRDDLDDRRQLLRSLNTVKGVPQMLHEQGFADGTQVISARLEPSRTRAARLLQLAPGSRVMSALRLRFADGDTLSLEQMYLGDPQCFEVLRGGIHNSVYASLEQDFGISITTTDETIQLTTAPPAAAALLRQPPGTPALRVERIGYDDQGRALEYSVDLFRADRTRLNVRTTTTGAAAAGTAAGPVQNVRASARPA